MFILAAILSLMTVCPPAETAPSIFKDRQAKKTFTTKDGKVVIYKKVPTKWVKTPKKSI